MHAYARPVLWMRFEDACNDDVKGGIDGDLGGRWEQYGSV
jgi:hypothetical protein